jgi:prepilin-type N-terminal cleavage/methylation domain-containing protein
MVQQKIRHHHEGFTLVEIMIVVAIIALLAAIAVPGFLRARKRSQATAILNDARVIGGAVDQYSIENNEQGTNTFTAAQLKDFFKPASRLYVEASTSNGVLNDILGNNYSYNTFDGGVLVNTATTANFTDVIDNASSFWGPYYP